MRLTLTEEQEIDLARMMNEPTKAFLLAHQMGFGKSVLLAEWVVRSWFEYGLIVGPPKLAKQWAKHLHNQSEGHIALKVMDTTKAGEQNINDYISGVKGIYFIGVQLLSKRDHITYVKRDGDGNPILDQKGREQKKTQRLGLWSGGRGMDVVDGVPKRVTRPEITPEFIVYDESHMASNRYTNAAATLRGMNAEYKALMSGTFYADKFENAYTPIMWLWSDRVDDEQTFDPSFNRWKERWCSMKDVYVPGGRRISQTTGEKHPGLLVTKLPCYLRRESLDEAPSPRDVLVGMSDEQKRVYDELEEQMLAWIRDRPLSVDFPITLQAYLRMVTLADPSIDDEGRIHFEESAASVKADKAIAALGSVWKSENVLHATSSKRYANYLVARLRAAGYTAEAFHGDTKPAERERIRQEFSEGKIQNLVGVIAALNAGTDGLQMNCCKILEHNTQVGQPSMMAQFIRRIWRQGNPRLADFEHVRLVAENTIETGQYASNDLAAVAQKMSLKGAA